MNLSRESQQAASRNQQLVEDVKRAVRRFEEHQERSDGAHKVI